MAQIHISKDPPEQIPLNFPYASSFVNKTQKQIMWISEQGRQPGSSFNRDKGKIPKLWSYAKNFGITC